MKINFKFWILIYCLCNELGKTQALEIYPALTYKYF